MYQLGISVYLDKVEKKSLYLYLEKAAALGYSRIFTCFLSIPEEQREAYLVQFKEFTEVAHGHGFEVAADTNPDVFNMMGATSANLKPFADLGLDILRLDGNFGGLEDVLITHNPYNIKIAFNASTDMGVALLIKNGGRKDRITMCHNFFPERYTGLDETLFKELNQGWKDLNLRVAAFVSSNQKATVGPWPLTCGLVTVEILRGLPIDLQARYMLATENVDDVIIGNYPATDEELEALARINEQAIEIEIDEVAGITEIEKEIIYDFAPHMDRQDRSTYMIRSSWVKGNYKAQSIPHRVCDKQIFTRGDVLIVNDNLQHYRGELQIVLTSIPNDGERNLVATISQEEQVLLELIKPRHLFKFLK